MPTVHPNDENLKKAIAIIHSNKEFFAEYLKRQYVGDVSGKPYIFQWFDTLNATQKQQYHDFMQAVTTILQEKSTPETSEERAVNQIIEHNNALSSTIKGSLRYLAQDPVTKAPADIRPHDYMWRYQANGRLDTFLQQMPEFVDLLIQHNDIINALRGNYKEWWSINKRRPPAQATAREQTKQQARENVGFPEEKEALEKVKSIPNREALNAQKIETLKQQQEKAQEAELRAEHEAKERAAREQANKEKELKQQQDKERQIREQQVREQAARENAAQAKEQEARAKAQEASAREPQSTAQQKIRSFTEVYSDLKGKYASTRKQSGIKTFFAAFGHKGSRTRTEQIHQLTTALTKLKTAGTLEALQAFQETTLKEIKEQVAKESRKLGKSALLTLCEKMDKEVTDIRSELTQQAEQRQQPSR